MQSVRNTRQTRMSRRKGGHSEEEKAGNRALYNSRSNGNERRHVQGSAGCHLGEKKIKAKWQAACGCVGHEKTVPLVKTPQVWINILPCWKC